jgi:HEAT repeat protein
MFVPPPLPRTVEATFRDLSSDGERVRVSALQDLGRHLLGDDGAHCRSRACEALEKALADSSAKVREIAAIVAGEASMVELVPRLLVALEDPHTMVRQMAMDALGQLGDERALPRVERALTDERPELRYQAVIAFGKLARAVDVAEVIAQRIIDDDAHVRYIALRVAEERGLASAPAIQGAAEKSLSDEDARVKVAAALLLASGGNLIARGVLAEVVRGTLRTTEAEDERGAVESVGELGMTELAGDLERRAWGLFRFARETYPWHAKIALAALGHVRAVTELLADLRSTRREVREAAVVALGRARVPSAREPIRALAPQSVDETLRRDALARLKQEENA